MWIALAIAIISIFFMLLFRKNIARLIDRIKSAKLGKHEFKTEAPTQNPAEPQNPMSIEVSSAEKLIDALNSPAIRETEEWIKETLKKTGIKDGPEKEKVLLRYLAATDLAFNFQRINSLIWGSQIYILEHLNGRRMGESHRVIKESFYDEAVKRWPLYFASYPYESYIGYLKAEKLVLEQGENLFITNYGIEFLQYLVKTGKSGARFRPG